ncbi:YhhN-like protein [Mariniphaga anaerophila]|uniref:YhhN-like protein n=1 Tax=Mariniphaga anaerophila TaxID=1484053 RepID=A0A1M5G9Y1_9BACT|nr:lysoplasmalogenase [Mariniphaga anaerophila]SHG00529.1 YhhN-like protein [Mariniphaga anaerophila]
MSNFVMEIKKNSIYLVLLLPFLLAVMALNGFGFFFKSGSAGAGILIVLWLWFRQLKARKDVWMIFVAFAFSIGGDWFMSNRNGDMDMFISGIALFFVAHIGYLGYALLNGKVKWTFTAIVLAGYLVFFTCKLLPSINHGVLMFAALVYLIISCLSMGAAVGIDAKPAEKWSYVFGIFLVLFSDTIIAFSEFAGYTELNFLILPTYYLAHISVTFSLIARKISYNPVIE